MYRLEGDVPGLTNTAAGAIKANVGVVAGSSFLLFVNVAFVLVVLALVAKGYRFGKLRHSLWFLVPALLPFLWFAILRNHSEAHAFLIYRTVVFSLLCTWAVVLYGMMPAARSSKPKWLSWSGIRPGMMGKASHSLENRRAG